MPHTHTHSDSPVIMREQEVRDDSSGLGVIAGIIMAIVVGLILLFYGIPFLANSARQSTTPEVNVPDRVDVNLNQ